MTHAQTHVSTPFLRIRAIADGLARTASVALLAGALGTLPALAQDPAQAPPSAAVPAIETGAPSAVGEAPGPAEFRRDEPEKDEPVKPEPATKASLPNPAKIQHDLSPMGMFLNADPVVKGVMILLMLASVVTWTILFVKSLGFFAARHRLRSALAHIRNAGTLGEAGAHVRRGVALDLIVEAEKEKGLSHGLQSEGIKERAAIALHRIEVAAGRRMAAGTGILATIGSIGPFVGLFGTVWGIMGSFIGIANSNTTNLAVVAPGIAEALLATGIGLVAAIPAVVIYNSLTRAIGGYRILMGDAVAVIMCHLSRDLDRHEHGGYPGQRVTVHLAAE